MDRNSGCLRCLWLLFISSSVKLFKLNSKLMQGASQYIDIQQSSLAVSTNAPCTNATSESVFLIHEIIESNTLLRSSKLETLPAPGQKGTAPNTTCGRDAFVPATAAICTVCLSQLPWIHGHIPGSKSSDCSARSRHVKCIQMYRSEL